MLPAKRKRQRSGIERAPQRIFAQHRRFVKQHSCSIRGCEQTPIEFAHLRTAANSGIGQKPGDQHGISLCRAHHARAHNVGHDTMARENGMTLDQLHKIAAEFARLTPDRALREMLREKVDG